MDEGRLLLHLHSEGEHELAGQALKAIGPLAATLSVREADLVVDVTAPTEMTAAELRWGLGQLCAKVGGAFPLGRRELTVSPRFSAETALTLALDQHASANGRAHLHGRDELSERLAWMSGAVDEYRGWVDEDPTSRTSVAIARDVATWAERHDVDVSIMDESALAEAGLRLLLAVGGASELSPPRLVVARYRPGDSRPPRMLLGKGITFDSGGINVKPYESFVSMMKNDMGGSALAWSCFRALVERGVERPLLLVLPTCENPVGENAMRPGTVVKSYAGKTVRIDHTDAEGRLVLADALAWAQEHHAPSDIHCFATLTTSALNSYGPYATPVHFADEQLKAALSEASSQWGEDLHFFPSRIWHREANKDHEADLRNTGQLPGHARRGAGSRNAAHFLRWFADRPFVHFDIFGSTWNWAGDAPGGGVGATGAPLRTLLAAYEREG